MFKQFKTFIFSPNIHLVFLLLIVSGNLFAQPGWQALYKPFDPFDTCNKALQTGAFVFIGKIEGIKRGRHVKPPQGGEFVDLLVSVKRQVKGTVDSSVVLSTRFMGRQNVPKIGNTYVFLAQKWEVGEKKILFSGKWSYGSENPSSADLDRINSEIRNASQKTDEKYVLGKLVNYDRYSTGLFPNAHVWLNKGYNPSLAKPVQGQHVKLISKEGRMWSTITDEEGVFRFDDIPNGEYQLDPNLGRDYLVRVNKKTQKKGATIPIYPQSKTCNQPRLIEIAPSGNVKVRLTLPKTVKQLPLVSLEVKDKCTIFKGKSSCFTLRPQKIEIDSSGRVLIISAQNFPIGKYLIHIYQAELGTIYFPNTENQNPNQLVSVEHSKDLNYECSVSVCKKVSLE